MEIKEDDHNQFDMLEGSFANEFDYGLVEDFSHDARPVNSPIKADCQGKKRMEDYLQWEASLEYFFEMKPMVDLGRYTRNALMAGKHVLQDGARRKLSRKSDGIAQRRTRGKKGKALVRFEAGNGIGHNVLSLAATLKIHCFSYGEKGSHYCLDSLEQRVNKTEKEEQDDDMLDPIYN
ncbi:hypothetical protein Gorai_013277, partial [Gossypium raimondii]|nr:hypothetical protein [Gossypium raimondii]